MTKNCTIKFRCTDKLKNMTEGRARLYAEGNVSRWITYCLENAPPKILKQKAKKK